MGENNPIEFNKRIFEIDGIRGFALLGILMMNIMSFAGPDLDDSFTSTRSEIYTGFWNELSLFFINTFITTNFYTMFSFLFGLGFYIFLSRAEKKTQSTAALFLRRIALLLVFGLLHGILLWYGDILWTYAVTGLFLLLFYKFKPKVNLIIAVGLLSLSTIIVLLSSIGTYMMNMAAVNTGMESEGYIFSLNMTETILNGSYGDVVGMNAIILGLSAAGAIFVIPNVLAMFLLGLYAGQKGYFNNLREHTGLLRKVAVIGIGVGLPVKIFTGYLTTYEGDDIVFVQLAQLSSTIGGPLMSLGYVAALALILLKLPKLVRLLQPVGQMALTNYIGQTVIMLVIFYVFGLFNSIDAVWFIPIATGVFILQLILSHFWMKYFSYGPLEWIWRNFTYLKMMPFRKR
ncbi:DUF418 domain-containing protein [Jeotgalicoccus psychrophilus]|uniref:DUF418 domain-containing protein n=1 Tax=Jeotgalicoccus psychrophilus TaxID=157228 RepID=UPI0004294FF1|nr:DUF418 domain-containing protein [Jeotgalicoccus psychrophilus]